MPLNIVCNEITKIYVDAIEYIANIRLSMDGSGSFDCRWGFLSEERGSQRSNESDR